MSEAELLFAPNPAFAQLQSFNSIFEPLAKVTSTKYARSTKVMITAGPSCQPHLQELIDAGVDAIRFNMAYDLDQHNAFLAALRECRGSEHVCLIADIMGRGARTGRLKPTETGCIKLRKGQKFTLWSDMTRLGDETGVGYSIPELSRLARVGDKVYLANGAVALEVESVSMHEIVCQVLLDGELEDNKGLQIRGLKLPGGPLTDKDRREVEWAAANKIDYVALSFAHDVEDIMLLKKAIGGRGPRVIAKIETRSALSQVQSMIEAADAIQISRGDLSVAVQAKDLTSVQKDIIRRCNLAGKPVVLASQLLTTMVVNPRPTRAECTDAMNAVFDGIDCVMLTTETAKGAYAVEAAKTLIRLTKQADGFLTLYGQRSDTKGNSASGTGLISSDSKLTVEEAVAAASVNFATDLKMPAILTLTETGRTALYVAKYRPPCPVFCCTPLAATVRRLGIVRGCHAVQLPPDVPESANMMVVVDACKDVGAVQPGETVVVTLGSNYRTTGSTDMMHVITIE
jgi:pyruvate kinase